MNRFLPPLRPAAPLAAAALLVAAQTVGCGPTPAGAVYTDAGADEAAAPVAEDATPAADNVGPADDGGAENPAEPGDAGIELAGAEAEAEPRMSAEEDDDGFTFGGPPPAAEDDGFDDGGFVTPAAEPADAAAADAGPRELKLLKPLHSFPPVGDGTVRASFDDLDLLKVLNAEPVPADVVDHFPDWLSELEGKEVTLRGFMYPTYADPVRAFILARDNQICCFGRNPKPYDLVTVRLAEGAESRYIQNRPFDVVGTFHIDPQRDGDDWLRLYRIDGARVVE